jgi:hypothetical protein
MRDHPENAARIRLNRRDGVAGRARHGARSRDPEEPHLEDTGLQSACLHRSSRAVEPATEVLARAREAVGHVRDALARDARDDGDSAHGAVRAALLCDERARDVLPEGECRATEGQEERE